MIHREPSRLVVAASVAGGAVLAGLSAVRDAFSAAHAFALATKKKVCPRLVVR